MTQRESKEQVRFFWCVADTCLPTGCTIKSKDMKGGKRNGGLSRSIILTVLSMLGFFFILVILLRKFPQESVENHPVLRQKLIFNRGIKTKISSGLEPVRNVLQTKTYEDKPISSSDKPSEIIDTTKPTELLRETMPVASVTIPPIHSVSSLLGMDTVLLVICSSSRPDYLKRTLTHVLKYHPLIAVPIVISQDGYSKEVEQVVMDAKQELVSLSSSVPFIHLHHDSGNKHFENGYFKLADHFKWALDQVFLSESLLKVTVNRVIVLEEDLQIAPDFFDLFAATAHLLDHDDSVLAVSAWNDNGMKALVRDPEALYRSDFFPGLGWMLSRKLWVDELSAKWPRAYWDDWLREPKQRKDRHIIRPEICRTLHFGTRGVSNAQYSDYLDSVRLNDVPVRFAAMDLNYLAKTNWDREYMQRVRQATLVTMDRFDEAVRDGSVKEVRVVYHGLDHFPAVAKWARAMDNIKANVPRTAYRGVVTVWKGVVKVHLVPDDLVL